MSQKQLKQLFKKAACEETDELDFFIELQEQGYQLKDIQKFAPEHYEYAKDFMMSHGLI